MRVALLVALLLAGCASPLAEPDERPGGASNAIVVSSSALAAEAGAEILRAGGNAADAAAAVAFALTVVEPHLSGIGGGTFILHRAPGGAAYVIDGRETAPAASTSDQFLLPTGEPMPSDHADTRGFAVGVYGAAKAWARLVEREGELPLAQVLAPAIRYAEDGFPVDAYLARFLADPAIQRKLHSWPASAKAFYKGAACPDALPAGVQAEVGCTGGTPYAAGETLRQPDLARTLRLLAERGPDALHEGEVAQAVVDAVALRQGRMTLDDLARYDVVERAPLRMRYGDVELLSPPPPAGGVITLQILGLLEPLRLRDHGHHSAQALHLLVEAKHLAYADRARYLADPAFADVPTAGLLDPSYLAQRRKLIDPQRANPDVGAGEPPGAKAPARTTRDDGLLDLGSHTSHLAVADAEGRVVSATATIEDVFGSGMRVPGWGFMLNDELTDFDFRPGGANEVEPGKRPRSAMSPTIGLRDGEPVLIVGAAGGPTIISSVAQVTLALLEQELDVEDAVKSGRVYSSSYATRPWNVRWDRDVPSEALQGLRDRGHSPEPVSGGAISQLQAAVVVDGRWVGAADTRAAAGGVVYVEAAAT